MKSINIKGKEYITVNERIKYFNEHFPKWQMLTSYPILQDDQCLCEAKIFDEDGKEVRNGHAHEFRKGNINMTSMIENAETSAVGRALGMLGIGIDTSVASADEVRMAIEQQENINVLNSTPKFYPPISKATKEDHLEALKEFKDIAEEFGADAHGFIIEKLGQDIYDDKKELYKSVRAYLNNRANLEADLEEFADRPAYATA